MERGAKRQNWKLQKELEERYQKCQQELLSHVCLHVCFEVVLIFLFSLFLAQTEDVSLKPDSVLPKADDLIDLLEKSPEIATNDEKKAVLLLHEVGLHSLNKTGWAEKRRFQIDRNGVIGTLRFFKPSDLAFVSALFQFYTKEVDPSLQEANRNTRSSSRTPGAAGGKKRKRTNFQKICVGEDKQKFMSVYRSTKSALRKKYKDKTFQDSVGEWDNYVRNDALSMSTTSAGIGNDDGRYVADFSGAYEPEFDEDDMNITPV